MWSTKRISLYLNLHFVFISLAVSQYKFPEYKEKRKTEFCSFLVVRGAKKRTRYHTTSASILASITVDGAYFAAYPYIRAKAACTSSDSSVLKSSEKKDRNLQ